MELMEVHKVCKSHLNYNESIVAASTVTHYYQVKKWHMILFFLKLQPDYGIYLNWDFLPI